MDVSAATFSNPGYAGEWSRQIGQFTGWVPPHSGRIKMHSTKQLVSPCGSLPNQDNLWVLSYFAFILGHSLPPKLICSHEYELRLDKYVFLSLLFSQMVEIQISHVYFKNPQNSYFDTRT